MSPGEHEDEEYNIMTERETGGICIKIDQEKEIREKNKLPREKDSFIPALTSHAISGVFDVKRGMQGGKGLN